MKKFIFALLIPATLLASPQGVPTYTFATGINGSALGAQATQILPVNLNRGYLIIQNYSGVTCNLSPVSFVSPNGLIVLNGQNWETDEAFTKTAWYAACAAPNSTLRILETNY